MNYKQIIFVSLISLLTIAFIIIIFVFLPSNNLQNPESVETTIRYVSHISDAQLKIIDNFNEKFKGRIKVEAINLPFEKFSTNERKELLARYLRSKSDRIDVFTVDQIWVPRFAKWATNLDKNFTTEEEQKLVQNALHTCIYQDSLVAVPLYLDVAVMFYRDDLLKKIAAYNTLKEKIDKSITWTDLINIHDEFFNNNKSEPLFLFPGDSYEGLVAMFVEMMESQGKSLIENEKLQLSSPEAYNALNLIVNLINKYNISPSDVVNSKEKEIYDLFLKKNILLLRGWPAFINEYPKLIKDNKLDGQIKMAPTPHFKSGKSVSIFGGWNLMVSRFSPHFNEAVIFIKYLVSEEAQEIMYKEGDYIPINKAIYNFKEDDRLQFYQKLINSGVHRPFLENYTRISDIIAEYLNKAIKLELSVKQALKSAEEKINNEKIEIK